MPTPLTHVGQTAHPEQGASQQSQSQSQSQGGQPGGEQPQQASPGTQAPGSQPGASSTSDAPRHPPQQQSDFSHRSAEPSQQRQVDAEDDPASDANTESANHPNDE